ncbi:hypothetical protein DENIS_4644 [Desulfonema ishimotonii]|uniref:Uncharacterized protein n=1 Tax=Desulfonema ishimotonii TaxID=45657 RepID=A0A401G352_9BACT|nr:hypothetical protein [Desulfonema ishimotonii]GBC63646.1 hypothetical protein DENIS_4644 [Desulfonema ishimotonii]
MQDLTYAQKARLAVRSFQTIAHALALKGYYRPSEKMGQSLAESLENLSPEIYGSMNDPRVVELSGLEYVIDRLPRGIEECTRIILTEEEEFDNHIFEKIEPLRRRRTCYRISKKEMCFTITRGLSEIYDILTHLTFLNSEAAKIHRRMQDESGARTVEWNELEKTVQRIDTLTARELEQAIWNLSIILGRPYHQTRASFASFEKNKQERKGNNGLFSLICHLGKRVEEEQNARENALIIYLTPSLMNIIGHQKYGEKWAYDIKKRLRILNLHERPLHIISANLHSVVNLIYGYGAMQQAEEDLYEFILRIRDHREEIRRYAGANGFYDHPDRSGTHIDCQVIDTARIGSVPFHPGLRFSIPESGGEKPVFLVMDYAFGIQAFEVMDNLLTPFDEDEHRIPMDVRSVSVMGKAGILTGQKGDIMLANAHVIEGTSDNYIFQNDLKPEDFDSDVAVHAGPMITVLGTSLQNRAMLKKFRSSWNTVGLEMEGGHYQRAISAAIIKGHISDAVKVRYAYYASDNPLASGQTLAAGEMGDEGVRPTYMVTKVILEKILAG